MHSLQQQWKIYLDEMTGNKPLTPVSYSGLEEKAKQRLPPQAFAYLNVGAGRETTIHANRSAFDLVKIHSRMLGGVQEVSMQFPWREYTLPAPFMLASKIIECLTNILSKLQLNMALSGCATLTDIQPELISHPWKTI